MFAVFLDSEWGGGSNDGTDVLHFAFVFGKVCNLKKYHPPPQLVWLLSIRDVIKFRKVVFHPQTDGG